LKQFESVRVLVLGGSGFIGRWVARELDAHGARVVVAARDVERTRALLRELGARCEVRSYDLSRAGEVAALLAVLRPTIVFNLAGYGVDPSERDEQLAQRLNGDLVAEIAAEMHTDTGWRGQAVVHAGSALEYGTTPGDFADPWRCSPTTLYGRTKLDGSRRLAEIAGQRGLRAVTARLFTVYGPGEHSTRLVPTLLEAARTSEPIPLTEGKQRRDFTYVADVARGLLLIGASPGPYPERALNLATGRLESVRRFVEAAAHRFGIASERLRFGELPTRAEEMAHDPVSLELLERGVGWRPPMTIEQGLAETLAFSRR
jgi:nucleoside-diphosphate-sugar epimerase